MAEDHHSIESTKIFLDASRLLLLLAMAGALLLFFGITGSRIVHGAAESPTQTADVIVVFGAAEYVGRPSPFTGRDSITRTICFEKGMAPVVITTGRVGAGSGFQRRRRRAKIISLRRGVPEQASDRGDARLGYGAVGVARRQHHADEWYAELYCGERCLSCVPDSRAAEARRRPGGAGAAARVASAPAVGAVRGGDAGGGELSGVEGGNDVEKQLLAIGF